MAGSKTNRAGASAGANRKSDAIAKALQNYVARFTFRGRKRRTVELPEGSVICQGVGRRRIKDEIRQSFQHQATEPRQAQHLRALKEHTCRCGETSSVLRWIPQSPENYYLGQGLVVGHFAKPHPIERQRIIF